MAEESELIRKDRQDVVEGEPVPTDIEQLPPEMKTMVSVMAGFFRSTSGPDPETAKILAETEMHEESCKLEGFRESLQKRDLQNARDHDFRKKKLNHETARSLIVIAVCLLAIISGLYLIVVRNNSSLGTPILVAGFTAMLGGRSILSGDKKD